MEKRTLVFFTIAIIAAVALFVWLRPFPARGCTDDCKIMIKVDKNKDCSKEDAVTADPDSLRVAPGRHEVTWTMDPAVDADYELVKITFKDPNHPFKNERPGKKKYKWDDDYDPSKPNTYKYVVKVKPTKGGQCKDKDPFIVNN